MAAGFVVSSLHRSGLCRGHSRCTFSLNATLRRLSLLFAALLLAACAGPQKYSANPAFMKGMAQKPKQVLLLPPDIEVMEISAGGVPEKVEAWSKQAKSNIRQSLGKVSGRELKFIELPELSASEQETVDKYLAFYDVVGGDAFTFGRSPEPAWQHKKDNFDYTLGDGLHFLKQKTGADAALFVIGSDHISSGGRKAAMVVGALMGIVIPAGMTFVSAALVDLDSGNILWLNYDFGGGNWDIRNPEDTDKLVANIFTDYPGAK
jgi:hypothetical protein